MKALSKKERSFVSEFQVDHNATQAARRAGYGRSDLTAQVLGSRLLQREHVAAALKTAIDKREDENALTAELVEKDLLTMAQVDIRRAFNEDGRPKAIHQIPDDVAKAIISLEVNSDGEITKFRFVEKGRLYELLGKRLRMFTEIHEHTGKDGKPLPPAVSLDLSGISDQTLEKIAGMWTDAASA